MDPFTQILDNLSKKIYHPVYFLTGDEPYFIDRISDFIEDNVLSEEEKEFNQTVIYGRDTDVPSLISAAKRFPMMANYQVLIVKEAQEINNIEGLEVYLENPLETTLLVINYKYKKADKRKRFFNLVRKKGVLFESKKIYEDQIPGWISKYVAEKGCAVSPKAGEMLAEFLGSDLSKIVNEIEKLLINIPTGTEISDVMVEENIGISKDYNVFELQRAIGNKDRFRAQQIALYFAANPKDNPVIKTLFFLYRYFSQLLLYHYTPNKSHKSIAAALGIRPVFVNEYKNAAKKYGPARVKSIISLLREYDLKAKGVNNASTDQGELLRELLFRIMR